MFCYLKMLIAIIYLSCKKQRYFLSLFIYLTLKFYYFIITRKNKIERVNESKLWQKSIFRKRKKHKIKGDNKKALEINAVYKIRVKV